MPDRPPRPCTAPGCPALVRGKGSRCPRHQRDAYRRQDARRGTTAQRGYGNRWRRIRATALAREPLCRFCGEAGRVTAATEVDHIDGDSRNNDPENLRPLCKPCHSGRTMRDQVRRR